MRGTYAAASSSASCSRAAKKRSRGPTHSRQDPKIIAGEISEIGRVKLRRVSLRWRPKSARLHRVGSTPSGFSRAWAGSAG